MPLRFDATLKELARSDPKATTALDCLIFVMEHTDNPSPTLKPTRDAAAAMIVADHMGNARLGDFCRKLDGARTMPEQLLRDVAANSPHRDVRAQALMTFAAHVKRQANTARVAASSTEADLTKKAEQALEQLLKELEQARGKNHA